MMKTFSMIQPVRMKTIENFLIGGNIEGLDEFIDSYEFQRLPLSVKVKGLEMLDNEIASLISAQEKSKGRWKQYD